MTNKLVTKVLTYELQLPSYGDSKLEMRKKVEKIVWQSLSLVYGKWDFSDTVKNGTLSIFSSN